MCSGVGAVAVKGATGSIDCRLSPNLPSTSICITVRHVSICFDECLHTAVTC